jgi:hypothetical protein
VVVALTGAGLALLTQTVPVHLRGVSKLFVERLDDQELAVLETALKSHRRLHLRLRIDSARRRPEFLSQTAAALPDERLTAGAAVLETQLDLLQPAQAMCRRMSDHGPAPAQPCSRSFSPAKVTTI